MCLVSYTWKSLTRYNLPSLTAGHFQINFWIHPDSENVSLLCGFKEMEPSASSVLGKLSISEVGREYPLCAFING